VRAWGLRPRRARTVLAISADPVLPLARSDGGGTLKFISISRLNTQLASPPVNTSLTASQPPTHDSGPKWIATPSSHKTLTCYSPPVSPAIPLPERAPFNVVGT